VSKALDSCSDISLAIAALRDMSRSNSEFYMNNIHDYSFADYNFRVCFGKSAKHLEDCLELARKLDIDSAPIISSKIVADNGTLFILRYKGCEGLMPFAAFASKRPEISEASCRKFIDDMNTLASSGVIHERGMAGHAHWMIAPPTGTILMNAWYSCRLIEDDERLTLIQALNSRLRELIEDLR
jgi:hypothetical protein